MEKKTMRRSWILALCAVMWVSVSTTWAASLYVSPSGGGDGSKSSPMSLQSALNTASGSAENHILFLQQGTYDASAVGGYSIEEVEGTAEKSIRLSGGWDANYTHQSSDAQATTLDGNNTTRVLNLAVRGGTAATTYYLERLTIERGYIYGDNGAGIKVSNHAIDGGSINVYITECLVRNNHARKNASNQGGNGGGLFTYGYVEVTKTSFESNSSDYHGAAINFNLRSPYTRSLSPKVDRCAFLSNYNVGPGSPAGSAIMNFVSLKVSNSYFEGQSGTGSPINSSYGTLNVEGTAFYNNSTVYWGGAIQYWDSDGEVKNCLFVNNRAGASNGYGSGGAITIYDDSPASPKSVTVSNCTFAGNSVIGTWDPYAGAIFNRVQTLSVVNSIFWNNGSPPLLNTGTATISYSDTQYGLAGTNFMDGGNNINLNPEFAAADDFRLQPTSPCVDTGNNAAVSAGTDVDGNVRFYDGEGNGSVIVDMGAYELSPSLSISPSSHDFGDVTVGTPSSEQVFTLSNTSSLPLVISSAVMSGNDHGIDLHSGGPDPCLGPPPVTISPNTSCTLVGTFSPTTAGARYATQKLYSNDPDSPIYGFTVMGIGVSDSYEKVKLLNPNGAEVIRSGSLYLVRWGAPGTAASFKVKYSLDNGVTWKNPPNNIINAETSYLWEVPVLTKNAKKCLLSITGFAGPNATGAKVGSDRSDLSFKIEVIRLVTPNGKEKLTSNTLHDIRWETAGTVASVASVELYYTRDGGLTWNKIPTTIEGNPARYTWTVPSKKGTKCKVKVVMKDEAGKALGNDVSDGFFAIQQP